MTNGVPPRPALSTTGIGLQLKNCVTAIETAQAAQAHELTALRAELAALRNQMPATASR